MTTAFAALLIGVAGAALVLALVAYLWVNRTPSTNERFDEYGRIPLFGVDLSAAPPASIAPRSNRIDPPRVVSREIASVPASAFEHAGEAAAVSEAPPDHGANGPPLPNGHPAPVDTAALASPHGTADATPAATVAATPVAPAAQTPAAPDRGRDQGWGTARGWPASAEPPVTPRFVPPVREASPPQHASVRDTPPNGNGVYGNGVAGSMVEGHRIRFSTPMEGTLQFLPGRLEISSGLDTGREIRFVRVPGPNGTEVTFGRNEGPLYRHIQLRDQTVSREHARMTLVEGRWLLTNLSTTNPVAYNGRVLSQGEHQPLEDGDRLEMGEVVFSFRSR